MFPNDIKSKIQPKWNLRTNAQYKTKITGMDQQRTAIIRPRHFSRSTSKATPWGTRVIGGRLQRADAVTVLKNAGQQIVGGPKKYF